MLRVSRETHEFLVRLAAALLPPLTYVAIFVGIPLWSGELTDLRDIARRQAVGDLSLFGRAYRDNWFTVKVAGARERRPSILAIGSSRVLGLRSPSPSLGCLYNAGGAIGYVGTVIPFIERLGTPAPRVVLISLDQVWFAEGGGYGLDRRSAVGLYEEHEQGLYRGLSVSQQFLGDVLAGKIDFARIWNRRDPISGQPAAGINAIVNGNGFRRDGSYQYGYAMSHPTPVAMRISEAVASYRGYAPQLARARSVSLRALRDLDSVLLQLQRRGIHAIGFTPPFMPAVYNAISADSAMSYLNVLPGILAVKFAAGGGEYVDFTNPASIGGTDELMGDAIHPSSELLSRILQRLAKESPALREAIAQSCAGATPR